MCYYVIRAMGKKGRKDMIQAYKKVLEMESVAELKLEKDRKALEKTREILYQQKNFVVDRLIAYLKQELNTTYFSYKIMDMDGNIADILVRENSSIFEEEIHGKEFTSCNVEEFIDNRMFNNKDEIIIIDLNFDENLLNLAYICDSLDYHYLSYSDEIKNTLSTFINYVINKSMSKK